MVHSAIHYIDQTQSQPQQTIKITQSPTPLSLLLTQTRRYLLCSLYWYYLTQASWFGKSFPSISKVILHSTGAVKVPSTFGGSQLPGESGVESLVGSGAYWKGGHDVSGHTFMMVHSTLFLYQLIQPSLPKVFPEFYTSSSAPVAPRRNQPISFALRISTFVVMGVMVVWWWMLLMTSVFFHSPTEKFTGFVFGVLGNFVGGL